LKDVVFPVNEKVLVGSSTADDAGIYQLDAHRGLVVTTDIFTPIVDDPYLYGQIAAANALSDIYAMGGTPLCALNIICFPSTSLEREVFTQILKGGAQKAGEAGVVIIGGHSVKDQELKYGLAVTGIIDPAYIRYNHAVKPGDQLLLTKPIGTGVLTTALKNEAVSEEDIASVIDSMLTLNVIPAEAMKGINISACTDITGFGLLGHLWEMMQNLNVDIHLYLDEIQFFKDAIPYAREMLHIPGGTLANIKYIEKQLTMGRREIWYQNLLCDPQTSGGLLISMPASEVRRYLAKIKNYPYHITVIGEVVAGSNRIIIR
jgi:selenide,water dikinase